MSIFQKVISRGRKMKECEHEFVEDELFKKGVVSMFFGNIGKVKRETRMFCKKCGCVVYEDWKEVRT